MTLPRRVLFRGPLLLIAAVGIVSASFTLADLNDSPPPTPEPAETPFHSEEDYDEFEETGLALPSPTSDDGAPDLRKCAGQICEGSRARVIGGSLRGFTGMVLDVPRVGKSSGQIFLVTDTGIRSLLPAEHARPIRLNADCYATFCRGDKAKIAGRWNKGFQGYVIGFDRSKDQVKLQRSHSGAVVSSHIVFLRHTRW